MLTLLTSAAAAPITIIDLMPTLATLANVPNREQYTFLGRDLSPVLQDANVAGQSSILFTFDDENCGQPNGQTVVTQPNHIRCLIEKEWKFALYFDPSGVEPPQYELYDRIHDPEELHNKAHPDNVEHYDAAKVEEMMAKLTARMIETGTLPHTTVLPLIIA
jgi:arylsulfatase A-like enzyme